MFCKYEGEPKDGSPATISITSGFICGMFGTAHPVCRLLDFLLPTPGLGVLLKGIGKALKGLKYLELVKDTLENYEDDIIPTAEFCRFYPSVEIEEIYYWDVVAALSPFSNGELDRKVAIYTAIQLWNDNCQCKGKEDADPDSPYPDPLPVPDPLPPDDTCYLAYETYRAAALQSNVARAMIERVIAENPTVNLINIEENVLTDPPLVNGFPAAYWTPTISQQTPDENGCYCFQVRDASVRYVFDNDVYLDGVRIPPQNLGFATSWKFLRWCSPPPEPDFEDEPVLDPDFLEDFCDIFPEIETCVKCAGAEHLEVDVPFNTACDEAGTITWGIDVIPGGNG